MPVPPDDILAQLRWRYATKLFDPSRKIAPDLWAKLEQAAELRADVPRILSNLAAAQVAAERLDDAITTLNRLAAFGVVVPVEQAEEFTALRGRKDFAEGSRGARRPANSTSATFTRERCGDVRRTARCTA